jgi:hypothetical protein
MANNRLAVSVGNFSSVSWMNGRYGSICDRRAVSRQAGLHHNSHHRAAVYVQLARDGADAPLLDMVIA